jgi:hypothetical protein
MTKDGKKRIEEIRNGILPRLDFRGRWDDETIKFLLAQLDEAHEALLDCISALSWLPIDKGPVRKRAGESIKKARKALGDDHD